MGRFEKLNDDIQALADKILEDQDLCKLIHYPDNNPLDQPNVNGKRHILDKRLLLFTPKIPLAEEQGTYVLIRVPNFRPSNGGYYISSLLLFDVYVHEGTRVVYYTDNKGNEKKGDRVMLILDRIEKIMEDLGIGIGQDNLNGGGEVANNNATFTGHSIGYVNVDFRKW
mgnify:CR=1 FL=1